VPTLITVTAVKSVVADGPSRTCTLTIVTVPLIVDIPLGFQAKPTKKLPHPERGMEDISSSVSQRLTVKILYLYAANWVDRQ
jgi:hypothetical protein